MQQFNLHQKVVIRKNRSMVSDKPISLSDWINQHNFIGEIRAIHGNTIEVVKLDSQSIYGKGSDKKCIRIDTDSEEYEIQPLRTEPTFQMEPKAIAMF